MAEPQTDEEILAAFADRLAGGATAPLPGAPTAATPISDDEVLSRFSSRMQTGFDPEAVAPPVEPQQAGFFSNMASQVGAGFREMQASIAGNMAVNEAKRAVAEKRGESLYDLKTPLTTGVIGMAREMWRNQRSYDEIVTDMQDRINVRDYAVAKAEEVPYSDATMTMLQQDDFGDAWDAFLEDPLTIISEVGSRSLAYSTPSLVLGATGGALGGAVGYGVGAGTGSFGIEYANSIMEGLQREGVDLSNAESIIEAVADEELMSRVGASAGKRAFAIGGLDALSGWFASKTVGLGFTGPLARETTNVAIQTPVQGALGGAGEAIAQYWDTGELKGGEIMAEIAGEGITAPVDVGVAALSGAREQSRVSQQKAVEDLGNKMDELETEKQRVMTEAEQAGLDELQKQMALARDPNVKTTRAAVVEARQRFEQEQQKAIAIEEALAEAQAQEEAAVEEETTETEETTEPRETIEPEPLLPAQREVQQTLDEGVAPPPAAMAEEETEPVQPTPLPKLQEADTLEPEPLLPAQEVVQEQIDEGVFEPEPEPVYDDSGAVANEAEYARRELTEEPLAQNEAAQIVREFEQSDEPVANPAMAQAFQRAVDEAANEAATSPTNEVPEPTDAQIQAGNYRKGHVRLSGMDISIENPRGSIRESKNPNNPWRQEMQDNYGYIRGTRGPDGDPIDIFVGDQPSNEVYVIDQIKQNTGEFDEPKVMYGYPNAIQATRAYRRNYERGWKVGKVTTMSIPDFKQWVYDNNATQNPAHPDTPVGTVSEETLAETPRESRVASVAVPELGPVRNQEIGEAAQEAARRLGTAEPIVMESFWDLQESNPDLFASARQDDMGAGLRGMYDPVTDQTYVFTNNLNSAEEAEQVVLHETLGHQGLRALKPDKAELADLLQDVYANAQDREALEQLRDQYGFTDSVEDQWATAEEYIAKIAETGADANLLQRVVDFVRKQLRRIGAVREYTDADIRELLRNTRKALRERAATTAAETEQASVEARQLDKRIDVLRQLRGCLNA